MTFPNAYSGVKKIFTSQILVLIGVVLIFIAALAGGTSAISAAGGNLDINIAVGTTATSAGIALVGSVLVIVGYIINLVGLSQAGKDERRFFRPAFIIAIAMLILSIVAGLFTDNYTLQNIVGIISGVAELIVIILTVLGIGELAFRLNRPQIASFGKKVMILIIVARLVSMITQSVGTGEAALVVAAIGSILGIVSYIAFLMLLSRGKNMLQTS